MKTLLKSIWDMISRSVAYISVLGFPASVLNIEQNAKENDEKHKPKRTGDNAHKKTFLETRGYRDSFANDDEVRPSAKEDVLILDAPLS